MPLNEFKSVLYPSNIIINKIHMTLPQLIINLTMFSQRVAGKTGIKEISAYLQ